MSTCPRSTVIIVVEHRRILGELMSQRFRNESPHLDVYAACNAEDALKAAAYFLRGSSYPQLIFALGGRSYWTMIDNFQELHSVFPHATYVMFDDHAHKGCGLTADRISIQGYFSLSDEPKVWKKGMGEMLGGHLYITPQGKDHLAIDSKEKRIVSLHRIRSHALFSLTEKEWICFNALACHADLSQLAKKLGIKARSAKNLQYQVMQKLKVKKFVELLRLALEWGFLDSRRYGNDKLNPVSRE